MNIIVDYGLGNIRSLKRWFERGNIEVKVSRDEEEIKNADLLVLPGVGAFRDAIFSLENLKLDVLIKNHVKNKKPLIGICLGMQLLYEYSHEDGCYEGLGLLKGEIIQFDKMKDIKIPHMGWNQLSINENKYFNDIENDYVYFVHSYYASTTGDEVVGFTNYDVEVPGIVLKDNVLGFQFHPEKSGEVGTKILKDIEEFINDYIPGN